MSDSTATIPAGQPVPEPGVEPDGIDTPTLVMWSFVSVAIVLGVMFGAAALYFQTQRTFNVERVITANDVEADLVLSNQLNLLNGYREPVAEGDPYAIPIDEAKKLVLEDLQQADAE
ncbi:hypothetical protein MalM25_36710 [Planctomycetes bacterium MalM25]|nr:hypothetical protein MalM25_36710 [Planctomycetes bacterium MalM25]